jgi:hypothetical protein
MAEEKSDRENRRNEIFTALEKALKNPLCGLAAFALAVAALFGELSLSVRVIVAVVAGLTFVWTLLPGDIKEWLLDKCFNSDLSALLIAPALVLVAFPFLILPLLLTKLLVTLADSMFDTQWAEFFFNGANEVPTGVLLFASWIFWNYIGYRIYKNFQEWKQKREQNPPAS